MHAENDLSIPELDDLLGKLDTPVDTVDETPTEDELATQFNAALVAGASLLTGIAGNLLFFAKPIGINVFIYLALFLLAAFSLLITLQRPIVRKHALFAVPAAVFALLIGVRATPQLILFNIGAMLGSLVIVLHFTGIERFLGGAWFKPVRYAIETALVGWIDSMITVLPNAGQWVLRANFGARHSATIRSVLRGLVITLPVVAVFTLLLSSADAVFGDIAEQVMTIVLPDSMGSTVEQLITIVVFTMLAIAGLWTMITPRAESGSEPLPQGKIRRFRLNMIETSMVLASVNVLFVVFVMIQARYFFGGEANITAQGYTYAEYARRGFYELLMVSLMTMLLLVTLENFTYRKREEENTFRGLVVLMVGLTFVILIAAFQRLNLYENAYGYTRIRVMSGAFMIWLAILLGVLLVAILKHRSEVFLTGCIVAGMGFVLTLNLINMDGFIASRNIARFEDTGKLDVYYLTTLSDDAIPTVVTLIDNRDLSESQREQLLRGLGNRLYDLDRDHDARGLVSYHLSKNRAWHELDEHRDILAPYIYSSRY